MSSGVCRCGGRRSFEEVAVEVRWKRGVSRGRRRKRDETMDVVKEDVGGKVQELRTYKSGFDAFEIRPGSRLLMLACTSRFANRACEFGGCGSERCQEFAGKKWATKHECGELKDVVRVEPLEGLLWRKINSTQSEQLNMSCQCGQVIVHGGRTQKRARRTYVPRVRHRRSCKNTCHTTTHTTKN